MKVYISLRLPRIPWEDLSSFPDNQLGLNDSAGYGDTYTFRLMDGAQQLTVEGAHGEEHTLEINTAL